MLHAAAFMFGFSAVLASSVQAGAVLPDPTRPYDYETSIQMPRVPAGAGVQWQLGGIQIRADARTAILNGRLVREGDELQGARVEDIQPGEVVLSLDGRRLVLKLMVSTVKQPAGTAVGENSAGTGP